MSGANAQRQAHGRSGRRLWPIALMGLLLSAGFRRHDEEGASQGASDADRAAQESRRGRLAETPRSIPAAGWKDVALRVYRRIGRDRIVSIAAGVTFYALLAIFPAIAALVAIYGLFADPANVGQQVQSLSGVLPGGAVDVVRSQAERLSSQSGGTLGVAFVIGLAISLWSANAGMKGLFDALNVAYGEEEKRGFFRLNAVSLAFTLGIIVFAVIALGAVVALPHLVDRIGLGQALQVAVTISKWPALLLAIVVLISLLYRFGPSRDRPRWRWLTWGSAFAALIWIGTSLLFSWYTANFGSYNKTYGSLGAVVGFMTWIWLSSIVVLVGAMLNAEMEHQTLRDTTEGQPEPLGSRGATMADTIGSKAA